MTRRGLSEAEVRDVVETPEQVIDIRSGRALAQSIRVGTKDNQVYLLRVVVDISPTWFEVVTAYKTSRIAKYWKGVQ